MKQTPLKPLSLLQLDQLADQKFRHWSITIDPAYTEVEDVFRPEFWAASHERLNIADRLSIRAKDGRYSFMIEVVAKRFDPLINKTLVIVDLYPRVTDEVIEGLARSRTIKRVITVNGKICPRVERNETHGWRLMGFGNEIVDASFSTQDDATLALFDLMRAGGIEVDEAPVAPAPPPNTLPQAISRAQAKKADKQAQRDKDLAALKERSEANKAAGLA